MNAILQRLKSKTFWAVLIGLLLTAVETQSGFFGEMLPQAYRAWIVMFWPALMWILREMTTTALGDK